MLRLLIESIWIVRRVGFGFEITGDWTTSERTLIFESRHDYENVLEGITEQTHLRAGPVPWGFTAALFLPLPIQVHDGTREVQQAMGRFSLARG